MVSSIASNSTTLLIVTGSSAGYQASTYTQSGGQVSQTSIAPAKGTGILQTSSTFVARGLGSILAIAFSAAGSNHLQLTTSANGGQSWSSDYYIGNLSSTTGSPVLSSVGGTQLSASGWTPGLIALVGVGPELFLAFPTMVDGQVTLITKASTNYGVGWDGPYRTGPVNGTIQNLTLDESPAGLVYACWVNPDVNGGSAIESVFFPDGSTMMPPTVVSGQTQTLPLKGAPSVAVDAFQRPIFVWPSLYNGTGAIAYTGDYLGPNESLALVDQMVDDPLGAGDFNSPAQQAAFNSSIASDSSSIQSSVAKGSICNAQNTSALSLYAEVTHFPLTVTPGSSTVCASSLNPSNSTSPLVPSVGVDSPNSYLAAYADWLLESLAVPIGISPMGNATLGWGLPAPEPAPAPSTKATTFLWTGTNDWSTQQTTETISVLPVLYNPTSLTFQINSLMPGQSVYSGPHGKDLPGCSPPINQPKNETVDYNLIKTWTNVSINNGSIHPFQGYGLYPTPYVTNLTAGHSYYWNVTFSPQYQMGPVAECSAALTPPFTITKTTFTGEIATTLPLSGTSHGVQETFFGTSSSVSTTVGFAWANCAGNWQNGAGYCMEAVGNASLTDMSTGGSTVSMWQTFPAGYYGFVESGRFAIRGVLNSQYEALFYSDSRQGGWNALEEPSYSYGTGGSTPFQTTSWSEGFTLKRPSVSFWGLQISNITSTTTQVTWYATMGATGTITYVPAGGGTNLTVSGIPGVELSNRTSWRYTVVLHSLEPWTTYVGAYGIAVSSPGITAIVIQAFPSFTTLQGFWATEGDLPYDSISQTGGGAWVEWNLPNAFLNTSKYPTAPTVLNGSLTIWNSSGPMLVPVSSSEINQKTSSQWFDLFNFTLSGLNQPYGMVLELNYSTTPVTEATSQVLDFTYQKDTSGDGLTDLEKENGWNVTLPGGTETVTANANSYSTNGLVNDYYEKKYGLNPRTVDTAGSHMLDMWNLTFNLGSSTSAPSIPEASHLQLFWENNTTYSPFEMAQYPGGPALGKPLATNLNNISCSSSSCAGNSPYSSEVLWSRAALSTFLNLSGVSNAFGSEGWLRGVVSTNSTTRTLTISGKLSWGADPLARSTPADGIADGSRINALQDERLSLTISNLYAGDNGKLNTGVGYAASIQVYPGRTTNGVLQLSNCSAPANLNSSDYRLTGYTVLLPVNQTAQYETIQFGIVVNTSVGKTVQYQAVPMSSSSDYVDLTYDMLQGGRTTASFSGGPITANPYNGSLTVTLQAVPVGGKTPTYLWLPNGNSTVNGLPEGLERYTGEQSFDLVVVNASASVTSVNIPTPWGQTGYTVTLAQGLNNFVIPREQFLDSPIGEAVLLGKETQFAESSLYPTILQEDPIAESMISGFGGNNNSVNLEAYWQNRAITGSGSIPGTTEPGTPSTSNQQLVVMAATSVASNNVGGLPGDPWVYTSSDQPAALQAVVTLNVSSYSMLDLLLAGLLDNTSGGVNGTFQTVTGEIGTLGFEPAIESAIANQTFQSQGLYGLPANTAPPPSSPSGGFWGNFWNAVSAVDQVLTNPISLIGLVWTIYDAPFTYFNHLSHEALTIGAIVVGRTTSALTTVGKSIVGAFNAALNFISTEVEALFEPPLTALANADMSYTAALASDLQKGINDTLAEHALPAKDAARYWKDFTGSIFLLAIALTTAIEIALWLIMGFSLGAGFLVGIVVGLALSAVVQSLATGQQPFGDGAFVAAAPFSVALIWALTAGLNGSSLGPTLSNNPDYLLSMNFSASTLTLLLASGSFVIALIGLIDSSADAAAYLGLTFAVVGLFTALAARVSGNFFWGSVSVVTDVTSIGIDVTGLQSKNGRQGSALVLNVLGLVFDSLSAIIDFKTSLTNLPPE